MKDIVEMELYLKSGKSFTVLYEGNDTLNPESLTEKTLHAIKIKNGGMLFIQGNNIDYFVRRK